METSSPTYSGYTDSGGDLLPMTGPDMGILVVAAVFLVAMGFCLRRLTWH